ncbi:MAG: chromophore lyase CpcT/CpeT [Planctomycetota bacterium]
MRTTSTLIMLAVASTLVGCIYTGGSSRNLYGSAPEDEGLMLLAYRLTGSFSSAEQAMASPDEFFDIRLEAVRIWDERDDAIWLYVEQATAEAVDRPYRQRIYRLTREGGATYRSAVFELPGNARNFAGQHTNPDAFDIHVPEDLSERDGCDILLELDGDGLFAGSTHGTGCSSRLPNASYATSVVHISQDRMASWDRGYNEQGEQVWGSEFGPYIFVRVDD